MASERQPFTIGKFHFVPPRFRSRQSDLLAWVLERYPSELSVRLDAEMAVGQIGFRGHELPDFCGYEAAEMKVFGSGLGAGASARNAFYAEAVERIFGEFYPAGMQTDELVHVSCTGYQSPSGAQKTVARAGGLQARVSHLYHMGCYAAFPALRYAVGQLSSPLVERRHEAIDVVHTEFCTLQLNANEFSLEQYVISSLFADGFIKYTVSRDGSMAILSLDETILADSEEDMSWVCVDQGFQMYLSRHVPRKLLRAIKPFTEQLCRQAGVTVDDQTIYAIHPGGPRILDAAELALALKKWQLSHSRDVLFQHGNMSSVTLPKIWMNVEREREIPPGTLIVSLAFGPGLTLAGGVLRKLL